RNLKQTLKHLGSEPLAWNVALYMGLQSFSFYVILAWLPEILQTRGLTAAYSGWMLSLSQGVGFVGSLLLPLWTEKIENQKLPVIVLMIIEAVGILGLLLFSTQLTPLWVSLLGFALGGNFALALLFIVLRSADTDVATELSGMAQSIGYLLAATGPALFGFLHDTSAGWTLPLIFLLALILIKIIAGLGSARKVQIE